MIPKIIHYCWFGGKPLPESALKCIASWHRFFPEYEIKQWDETNFDVNIIPYTSDAYRVGKYAFVSDYARMWVLYNYGGIYFDTDVEVIKSFDDVLKGNGFMGFETIKDVNPGLGMALSKNSEVALQTMKIFEKSSFFKEDGSFNPNGIVPITTKTLVSMGLLQNGKLQIIDGVSIFPADWFNPLDDATGQLKKTNNTHSIHWFTKSWMSPRSRYRTFFTRLIHRILGTSFPAKVKKLIRR